MEIKEIKVANDGLEGLTIKYTDENVKDGRTKWDVLTRKIEHPVHLALERAFKDLRIHWLEIGEMSIGDGKTERDEAISLTRITGLKVKGNCFVLAGQKEVMDGKCVSFPTPEIGEGDGYENFEGVVALIKTILEETKLYMKGEVKVSDEEAIERWIAAGKAKDLDKDGFDALSDEEKKVKCREILENLGAVVMMDDDFEVGSVEDSLELENGDTPVNSEIEEIEIKDSDEGIVIPINIAEGQKLER